MKDKHPHLPISKMLKAFSDIKRLKSLRKQKVTIMGQGIKYGIAAAGTLLLLTILSWNADEKSRGKHKSNSNTIISGSTLNTETAKVEVTPIPKAEDRTGTSPTNSQSPQTPAPTTESVSADIPAPSAPVNTDSQRPSDNEDQTLQNVSPVPATPATPATIPRTTPKPKKATAPSNSDKSKWQKHSVKKGESLYAISRHYLGNGDKWQKILDANPRLRNPKGLRFGMTLVIPTSAPPQKTMQSFRPGKSTSHSPPDAAGDHEAPPGKHYTVQDGDTLSNIAAKQMGHKKFWKKLYNANRDTLPSPNAIRKGQKLVVPQ
jgi:nucleoid-associated protein YgaU